MAGFKTEHFRGIRPRRSALKLPEGEAVTASNLKLGSGDLVPWIDTDITGNRPILDDAYNNKTIYLYDNDGEPVWFEWSDFVSVARGTIKGDIRERIYYTGDGFPKMTYRAIAVAGGTPYPTSFRRLGIPAPVSPPTALGNDLPEDLDPIERRVIPNTLVTKAFEIVFVNWVVHPGTGTATAEWRRLDTGPFGGDIWFDLKEGDTLKIIEVIDKDTVLLGSATGTGAVAETKLNERVGLSLISNYWKNMLNQGNDSTADFVGWRIPDGLQVSISDHLLRVGDIIRVTRLDYNQGIILTLANTLSFFEQSWTAEGSVTVDGDTFTQTVNATVGANAAGTSNFPTMRGAFFYEVVREDSEASVLEDRTYIYTYVSSLGEEGPPSKASLVIGALDGDAIQVTGLVSPPTDGYDITCLRLYRTSSTIAGTEFQLVKEFEIEKIIDNTIVEAVKAISLGKIIDTVTWEPPPAGMQGITEMPNGMLVGFVGRTVHMCEPFFPHAWPPEYDQAIDYDIVGLATFGNSIVVLTEGTPYVLSGSHPRNVNIRPYKINQACVSAESIASNVDKVIYASPDGLVEIGVNGAKLITAPYVLKTEWAAFSPTTMVGEFHDGKYFGFFDGPDNVPQAPASVAITGTLATEAGVIAGGQTIILTLTSDTWVSAGANFNAERQNIIDGLVARLLPLFPPDNFITGFNLQVHPNLVVGDVARTNDTVVTVTLSAQSGYSITAAEQIYIRVPATALVTDAAQQGLIGNVPLTIEPLEDYSSIVMAFTERDSAGNDVARAVASHKDITDWDEWNAIGIFKDEIDLHAGAYSPSLDKWLAVGQRSNGAPRAPNTVAFATSINNGVTWTDRTQNYNLFTDTAVAPRTAIWDPEVEIFVVGGDNRSLQASPDGENWQALRQTFAGLVAAGGRGTIPVDNSIASTTSFRDMVLSVEGVTRHIYAACSDVLFLVRSPDLNLVTVMNTWSAVPITYVSSTGSKHMAVGAAVIISIGADNTDMEVCSTAQGAASGSSVGAINTYNCRGLTFGSDLWVAISNDFRIITCASGDQGTIGNWSSPSSTKAAGVNIKGITYDAGDGVTQGYGYIAFGEITGSSLGVIYTSPDATTWTLRHTMADTVDVDAMAVKYPEVQLAAVETAFAPTFNGARDPNLIGDTIADYELIEFTTLGILISTAWCEITCEVQAADAVIRIAGTSFSGGGLFISPGTPTGSDSPQADTTIFNLNQKPDKVRITMTSIDTSGSSTVLQTWDFAQPIGGWVDPVFGAAPFPDVFTPGEFIDDQFFRPLVGFEYGYRAVGKTSVYVGLRPPAGQTSEADVVITFTFQKLDFADLSVSYRIRAQATGTFISAP